MAVVYEAVLPRKKVGMYTQEVYNINVQGARVVVNDVCKQNNHAVHHVLSLLYLIHHGRQKTDEQPLSLVE